MDGQLRWLGQFTRKHADAILWRSAALALMLNLLLRPRRFPPASLAIGKFYLFHYWRPASAGEWIDIVVAVLIWPVGVISSAIWFTLKNGGFVARRFGRSRLGQFGDQLRLSITSGLLPPWYYIFELFRPGTIEQARSYLTRGQTKRGIYQVLSKARGSSSPLVDKEAFAQFCAERQVSALPVLLSVHDGEIRGTPELPRTDLFVKPVCGRGGRGAERWDCVGDGLYENSTGQKLSAGEFLDRLRRLSIWQPMLVQHRAENHPALRDLSNGALNTVRMISCLDEQERPEIIAAVFRMAVGDNVTVDNVHAGGLGVAIDLTEGRMMQGTDMGVSARLGWIDCHPDTGAQITGRVLPMWSDVCDLVRKAHLAFRDWVVVGWDVAIMSDQPRLVEGNNGPDIDLVQRPLRRSFGDARFGELLAHHLAMLGPR